MLKLKYSAVFSPMFQHSLRKLTAYPNFGMKLAYKIGRITSKIETEMRSAQSFFQVTIKKHVKKDEHGAVILKDPKDPSSYEFESPEAEAQFKREEEEFLASDITLDWEAISLTDLEAAGFKGSANELQALLPILTGFEVEAAKPVLTAVE